MIRGMQLSRGTFIPQKRTPMTAPFSRPSQISLRRDDPVKTFCRHGAGIVHDSRSGSGSGEVGQIQPANLTEVRSVLNLVGCAGYGTEGQLHVGGASAHNVRVNQRWG